MYKPCCEACWPPLHFWQFGQNGDKWWQTGPFRSQSRAVTGVSYLKRKFIIIHNSPLARSSGARDTLCIHHVSKQSEQGLFALFTWRLFSKLERKPGSWTPTQTIYGRFSSTSDAVSSVDQQSYIFNNINQSIYCLIDIIKKSSILYSYYNNSMHRNHRSSASESNFVFPSAAFKFWKRPPGE